MKANNLNDKIIDVMKNKSLMKVAWKAANQFKSSLNEDDLNTCIMHSIWRALRTYDSEIDNPSNFSTYLYRGVILECLSFRKTNIFKKMYPSESKLKLGSLYKTQDDVDMIEEIDMCDDPQIIYDRFYKNMTLSEMANERNLSKETIRTKIKKNIKILKKRLAYGV
jgi:DNA-directed RNA polymerase specialized sigma subunit